MSIISVKNFSKYYGKFQAVKDISFEVEEGTLFAFLGPNGAGKSTTIEALTTLTTCEYGNVLINGYHLGKEDDQIRRCIGVVYQQGVLDKEFTVYENLFTRGSLYGYSKAELKRRIDEVVKITRIEEILNKRYHEMSGGQQRRVDIARALLNTPKILFLDEPSTGIDPETRGSIWEMITRLQTEKNMTVFLTTHYMEEAVNAAKVVIIAHGQIVDQGTPAELKERYTNNHILLYGYDDKLMDDLKGKGLACELKTDSLMVQIDENEDVLKFLEGLRGRFSKFEVKMGTMDEMFINLVQREEGRQE